MTQIMQLLRTKKLQPFEFSLKKKKILTDKLRSQCRVIRVCTCTYCITVTLSPKVRLYAEDLYDVSTQVKINSGAAICHLNTSACSLGHGAFVALGSGPGLIEVCHWIFENDMTWTIVDI